MAAQDGPGVRVLHTADLHIGNTRFARPGAPWSRLEDQRAVLAMFVDAARRANADLAVVAGDLFDTRNPRPREWAVAAGFIEDVISTGTPLLIVDGNHDGAHVIGDESSRTLQPLAELVPRYGGLLAVPMGPDITTIGGAIVVSVPYPHRRAMGVEAGAAALGSGIRHLHERALSARGAGQPVIFVGHLTAAGATVGSERSMRLEDDVTLSLDVLDLFDYAALGHIHKQQRVSRSAWYAGSPLYVDFGEAGDRKGFLLASVAPHATPTVQTILSDDHPMFDIDQSSRTIITSTPTWGSDPDVTNAIVRVRVPDDEAARQARADYAAACFLQVDVAPVGAVMLTERAMPADTAPIDALRAYLTATMPGADLDPYLTAAEEYMA